MTVFRTTVTVATCLAPLVAAADDATERTRRHEPKMTYLDNGVIRLGVDLNLGGAITYLSRSGSADNLVNSFDFGRQIQMSYYSGPVPFTPGGKQPAPGWKFIGWNPIQVGDAFGNASKVLESLTADNVLHVKCVPMHWPLDNVPGECIYESRLTLDGPVVHARCSIDNDRPDHTQYPARMQELPAIYTNGPWYKLMTYSGDKPGTGGALTRIEKRAGEPGPWSRWTATESWAALVDDHDFGLGVVSPGVSSYVGGFAGKPGAGGPHDDPTGYVAPSPDEVIDWNIRHEYRYDLVVGSLTEIRAYAVAHAKPAPPDWRFASDRRGWSFVHATDAGWPIKGMLDVKLDADDPQLIGPIGCWRVDQATAVVEATSNAARDDAKVYWRMLGDRGFSEERAVAFRVVNDGSPHVYRVTLPVSGALTQLRIDPVSAGTAGASMKVMRIAVEGADGAITPGAER